MGFLATPKARPARSLASASTPAFRHRISTRSGCSCGSCESSWNAVQIGVLIDGLKARGEAVSRETLARVSPLVYRHIIPSGTYRFRDQRARLE